MAVDRNLSSSFQDTSGKNVHDFHHLLKGSGSHILPVLIFEPDVTIEKEFRVVTETYHRVNAIAAVWMLS